MRFAKAGLIALVFVAACEGATAPARSTGPIALAVGYYQPTGIAGGVLLVNAYDGSGFESTPLPLFDPRVNIVTSRGDYERATLALRTCYAGNGGAVAVHCQFAEVVTANAADSQVVAQRITALGAAVLSVGPIPSSSLGRMTVALLDARMLQRNLERLSGVEGVTTVRVVGLPDLWAIAPATHVGGIRVSAGPLHAFDRTLQLEPGDTVWMRHAGSDYPGTDLTWVVPP